MASGRSGAKVAAENVELVRRYLETVNFLPARDGKPNVAAIAVAAGVDRQVLYKNPECRRLLEGAVAAKGLRGIEDRTLQPVDMERIRLERRVGDLERANSALGAEITELRAKLRRYSHIEEHLVETGRLVR